VESDKDLQWVTKMNRGENRGGSDPREKTGGGRTKEKQSIGVGPGSIRFTQERGGVKVDDGGNKRKAGGGNAPEDSVVFDGAGATKKIP